jgi:hypothetical protein
MAERRRVRPLDERIGELEERMERLKLQKNIEELRDRVRRRTPVRRPSRRR